jgi:hypothetical protein
LALGWRAGLTNASTPDCASYQKNQIKEWITDYGKDSDFVRVGVRGLPPSASELRYIDEVRVKEACKRPVWAFRDEPLIAGFDVSGGGSSMEPDPVSLRP